ncbi:MAG: DUF2723 domain-containing protein [Candidatus Zixiibacteriota bacterium]
MVSLPKRFDKVNAVVAIAVWLTALIVYIRTQAPTLSFWDCGEFIACSYILGIPHPPGTPTYILFGRVASMLPTFSDICARVNLLSGLCSSLAAMFGYLLGVRIIRHWFRDDNSYYGRLLIYAGPAAGAMFLAFGRTQWNNSVEAEVYGMSMLLMFAIAWLAMVFIEHRGSQFGNKVMLLAVYLAFLGIGVHMTTFLILPIAVIVFSLRKETPLRYWFIIGAFFAVELYLIYALSSNPSEVPYYFPIAITGLIFIFYMLSFDRIPVSLLIVAVGFVMASFPGIAHIAGWPGGGYRTFGIVALLALIGYALYSFFKTTKAKNGNGKNVAGAKVAAIFVVVAVALAAVTKLGLPNGPQGYRAFLLISVVLALAIGVFIWRYVNLPVLVALVGPAMIVLGVKEFFWGTLASAGVVLVLGLIWKVAGWRTALLVIVMAVAGYSTHLFAPIRSSLHPYINENTPSDSLEATINFFERKQYGSQSMTERMFKRRGEWANQFGDHARMGFLGFFREQYGFAGRTFVVAVLLGAFGAWEACRRKPEMGIFLATLLLVATVGLILYMNFADGARQTAYDAWLEVRDRDYFFTPGFMLFGLAMGLGITATIQLVRDLTKRFSKLPRNVIGVALPALFVLPVHTLADNYFYCDRSRVYVPYDYAANILESCEPNAVLLTYGDNDTFPLWCLQEVYGVRRDVRSVCCALANGGWYIKQIRDYMGIELGWTDQEIDKLTPFRTQDGKTFRLQDQVTDAIISHNVSGRPIHFTLLANPSSRRYYGEQIDSLLEMRGLTYLLTDLSSGGSIRVPVEINRELMMTSGKLKYRGWTDPIVFRDEMTERSIAGVADRVMALADALIREQRWREAEDVVRFVADSVYRTTDAIETMISIIAETGDTSRLSAIMAQYPNVDSLAAQLALARAYERSGETAVAKALLIQILERHPSFRDGLDELIRIYIRERDIESMYRTLQTWVAKNPRDNEIREALAELQKQLEQLRDRRSDTP